MISDRPTSPPTFPQPLAPIPDPKPGPRFEGLLVMVITALGAVVVLASLVGFQRWRDDNAVLASEPLPETSQDDGVETPPTTEGDPSTTAPDQTPDETPRSEAPAVETVACPAQYDGPICDAAEFVQRVRGKPFKTFPVIELLEDAEFDAALVEDLEESRQELVEFGQLIKGLGLAPAALDLYATYQSLIESGVVGFYDPENGRLVVRGGEFDLYGQLVLVHELVHAFDDQWFDLSRDDFENDDQEYGYLAVIEGNASRVEERWRSELSLLDRTRLTQQEFSALSPEDIETLLALPPVILDLQASPYTDGENFVAARVAAEGEEVVDRLLVDPPESSEQVLHPNGEASALEPVAVEEPAVDGDVLFGGVLGELVTRLWLGQEAAQGWGGDGFVVSQTGDRTCITVDYAADSGADLSEIEAAATQWVDGDPSDRSVEGLDSVVRIVGCY